VLQRLGYKVDEIPRFSLWRVPWYWGWGYILGGALLFGGQVYSQKLLADIGINVFTVFSYVFLVHGLATAWFFLEKYRVASVLRYLIAFFAVMNQFLSQVLIWTGLFDAWLDLRKIQAR